MHFECSTLLQRVVLNKLSVIVTLPLHFHVNIFPWHPMNGVHLALGPRAATVVTMLSSVEGLSCHGLSFLLLTGRPFAWGSAESFVRCFVKRAGMFLLLPRLLLQCNSLKICTGIRSLGNAYEFFCFHASSADGKLNAKYVRSMLRRSIFDPVFSFTGMLWKVFFVVFLKTGYGRNICSVSF
jgi:hypothetical protein